MSSPEDDVDRLQPWGDVGLCDLWSVGLKQMRLGGFHIWDWCCQTLPQTQQVVNTVWGKLPVLTSRKRGTREDSFFHFHFINKLNIIFYQIKSILLQHHELLFHQFLLLNTHLQTGDSEVSYETNNLRVVFYFDQLPQLVVTLEPRQQATELMVIIGIGQTLKCKHITSLTAEQ